MTLPSTTPRAERTAAIRGLRWWIGGLLFASTIINHVDRQTLSLLAPYLERANHWTTVDYSNIVVAFRVAYSIDRTVRMRTRLMDRIGTKRGLTITVLCTRSSPCLRRLRGGFYSFLGYRFVRLAISSSYAFT